MTNGAVVYAVYVTRMVLRNKCTVVYQSYDAIDKITTTRNGLGGARGA